MIHTDDLIIGLLGLSPLWLILIGFFILWAVSWVRRRSGITSSPAVSSVLAIIAWAVMLTGVLLAIVIFSSFVAPVIFVAAVVVVISAVVHYWHTEVRFLVWTLAEAAERGLPLESAARAFANERHGSLGACARRLADYLDAAMPLSLAMSRSHLRIPFEVRLAADMGERTGTLGPSLRKAVNQMNEFEGILRSTLVKFFYLACLAVFMVGILTFLMIKIIPTVDVMFEEFGIELPSVTLALIDASRAFANYWYLFSVPMLLLGGIAASGLFAYMGFPFRGMPLISFFFTPIDNATIMRSLAVATRQKLPIGDNLALMAGFVPMARLRRRLHEAARRIAEGAHWSDALRQARLVTGPQCALFNSAERTGNLAWALDEIADSTTRRAAQKAQAVLSVLFPILLLSFGFCVLFVAVGILGPLFSLISDLA